MPKSRDTAHLDKHLAMQVRAHRTRLKMTSRLLDETLGAPGGTVSRIERGEKRLDSQTLLRFAHFLGMPIEAFFVGAPKTDVSPDPATQSSVPVAEVEAFVDLYRAISNKPARHEFLGLVRSVAESPHYSKRE